MRQTDHLPIVGSVALLLATLVLASCENRTSISLDGPGPTPASTHIAAPTPAETSDPPTISSIATASSSPTPPMISSPAPAQSPVTPSTPSPSPAATDEINRGPAIRYFRANVETADPGDTIVLEWESSGGSAALLYSIPPSGQLPQVGWEVAPTGVYTHNLSLEERNQSSFSLYVHDEARNYAVAHMTVKLRCPVPWFFSPAPEVCASNPIVGNAAEQHFEHGTMVWIEEEDIIFVLYDDYFETAPGHQWQSFIDEWDESGPDHDPALTPPDGLYQPARGFGLVWRQQPHVRDRLGWAVDQEVSFNTTEQSTTLYKYNSIYLRALDDNVWCLGPESSSWQKIMASEQ